MSFTRTLNPLPFEHLEPKRFEDLVRQLIYDFRMWAALEATGRSGSDDGFDARAIELVPSPQGVEREPDEDGEAVEPHSQRVWLIQCKREKAIGPSKIVKYLEAIPPESIEGLYGLVFAAACDFSKATRDACRAWCRDRGVQELHIWGRGEIEDQLFQPKNDNLLFAYFGISLQIRRQAAGTRIRRAITLKRRIRKMQESATWPGAPIIIRDPTDDRYPVFDQAGWERGDYLWRPAWSCGAGIHGLKVIVRQHDGYYDPDTHDWDFATGFNSIFPREAESLWPAPAALGKSDDILHAWGGMPQRHQMHFRLVGEIPYGEIIEIDQEPDDFSDYPVVFTSFRPCKGGGFEPPFLERVSVQLEPSLTYSQAKWVEERHVRIFPREMRDLEWEEAWSSANGWKLSTRSVELPLDPKIAEMRREIQDELRGDGGRPTKGTAPD